MQFLRWTPLNITLLCGLVGSLIAVSASFAMPRQYQASTQIALEGAETSQLAVILQDAFAPERLTSVIDGSKVYPTDHSDKNLLRMREAIGVNMQKGNVIQVSFRDGNPEIARRVTNELARLLIEGNLQARATHAASGPGIRLMVLAPPSTPKQPISPNRAWFAVLGFCGGACIGVLVALIVRKNTALPS